MSFEGGKAFLRMKMNDDGTFYIKVNRALLPQKTASYPVSVSVEDERGGKQLVKTKLSIDVEFVDKHQEA